MMTMVIRQANQWVIARSLVLAEVFVAVSCNDVSINL